MRRIYLLLTIAMLGFFTSCSDSEENNNKMTEEERGVFDYDWGTSMDRVKEGVATYQTETEDSTLYVLDFKPSCVVSYQFTEGRLSAMAIIGPKEQFDDVFLQHLQSGYTELGDVTSGKTLYVNDSQGKLMEIVESSHKTKPYYAVGWTKYSK
ncbi:MAG: hypothetical protein Q4F34_04075 [Prevotellaceae bacterium]|nr:hypothetical protein [Prevotellaceae bacterium]